MLACLPVQIFWIDWSAVFNDYVCLLDPREMCFKDFDGIIQGKRNNGTAGFLGNLEAAFLKFQHVIPRGTCTFRENADGTAAFDGGNTVEDRL